MQTGWERLRGHREQIEMFRRSVSRGRLGQAYLLTGPEGVGKKKFASILAQCLFCQQHGRAHLEPCGTCHSCKQQAAGTHPDFSLVELLPGKNELLIEQFIGPQERRGKEGLCHDLSLKPMSANRRIAAIDDADKMNHAAANALLKTLEEPPHGSLLLLVASNADHLLPTIRSRCQEVRFGPLNSEDVAVLLVETGIAESAEDAAEIAAACDGSLAVATELADSELRAQRRALFDALAADPYYSVETAARVMSSIEAAGGDAAVQRRRAAWFIRFCLDFYREVLEHMSGVALQRDVNLSRADSLRSRFPAAEADAVEVVGSLIERVVVAQQHLDRRMSVGLCMESLFDDLGRMTRAACAV